MSTEGAPLELAHYYPGWIWDDASVGRMKSLLLYFDGFALLLPEHHFGPTIAREERLAGPLHAAGLLHNLEPDTWLDAENAHRIRESADRSLPPSLVLPEDDPDLRAELLYELGISSPLTTPHFGPQHLRPFLVDAMLETGAVIRHRPDLGPDMVEMPPQAHTAALMALGLAAQRRITGHRLHLVGELPDSGGATTYTLHRDLADVGVDLSPVPLDEILDYRREHGVHYRAYARELRTFVHELEGVGSPADRERRCATDPSHSPIRPPHSAGPAVRGAVPWHRSPWRVRAPPGRCTRPTPWGRSSRSRERRPASPARPSRPPPSPTSSKRAAWGEPGAGSYERPGSSTKTGITRSVFSWYSAYAGYAATARSHHSARSSPVTSRAVISSRAGPSWSSTCGSDLRLKYQTGCSGKPPFEATAAYRPSCSTRITGILRILPLFAPRIVTMTTGRPVSQSVVPSVPPELSYSSTWSRIHCAGLGSYSPSRGIAFTRRRVVKKGCPGREAYASARLRRPLGAPRRG